MGIVIKCLNLGVENVWLVFSGEICLVDVWDVLCWWLYEIIVRKLDCIVYCCRCVGCWLLIVFIFSGYYVCYCW